MTDKQMQELYDKLSNTIFEYIKDNQITMVDKVEFGIDGLTESLAFDSLGACNDAYLSVYDKQRNRINEYM